MGSTLSYDGDEIWGENFFSNYKRLLTNPTLLRWHKNKTPAEPSLLRTAYLSRAVPLAKIPLWGRLLERLDRHPEFGAAGRTLLCAYDWRRSLMETAEHLGERLDAHAARLGSSGGPPRFVFFAHSMGGLVVRIALALGALGPDAVDRIVHIGSPLGGAPSAFASAYGSNSLSLPLLGEVNRLVRGQTRAVSFFEHLLDNVRTFDSVYQLMPPVGQDYLYHDPTRRSNPLAEDLIPEEKRALAARAHGLLEEAERTISARGIRTYTIYGARHNKRPTDLEYVVEPPGPPNSGYTITRTHSTTDEGDGTVSEWSARGNGAAVVQNPLWHVEHATMCNNRSVVDLLPGILAL